MIKLRKLELADLADYKYWNLPVHNYHLTNAPYFEKDSEEDVERLIQALKVNFSLGKNVLENKRIISNEQNEMIGEVSWRWKSEETNWMEIGIVIFNPEFRDQGVGYEALKMWMDQVFNDHEQIVRLGLSTWSGNSGMIKLAEKLGMKKEAEYRMARIVNGKYFDSISYGILKSEWEAKF